MRANIAMVGVIALACAASAPRPAFSENGGTLVGAAAYGDWRSDSPGLRRKLTPADMPAPLASQPAANPSRSVRQPAGASPKAPPGFAVALFAKGLSEPRVVRVAPNGDIFRRREQRGARARVGAPTIRPPRPRYRKYSPPGSIARSASPSIRPGRTRATSMSRARRKWCALPIRAAISRRPGRLRPSCRRCRAAAAIGRATSPFPPTARRCFRVGRLGFECRAGDGAFAGRPACLLPSQSRAWRRLGTGRKPRRRARLRSRGRAAKVFAAGLRNCSGLTVQPEGGALWCVVNERDILGDDLPPDYATRVKPGAFYGWPWYYIGANEDPRHKGERPDLAAKVAVPDVLIQPHSAPLGITFYEGGQFPAEYKGDAFVALHGSWNRAKRTGYKVVRLIFRDGEPTGEYEDFLAGLCGPTMPASGDARSMSQSPTTAPCSSTDDGGGAIWRVAYKGH